MKRLVIILISVLSLAFFVVACASGSTSEAATATAAVSDSATSSASAANDATTTDSASATATADAAANGTLELTLDQLKQYDGKNGNPAYVAVDGIIYDVTNVKAWKNGEHNGYSAGNDFTDIIKNKSPHGVKNLEGLPIVGKLVAG